MRSLYELAWVALRTAGFDDLGGALGWVKYDFYLESRAAGFRAPFAGAGTGGLLGFGWSVRQWYRRRHPTAGVEDEAW